MRGEVKMTLPKERANSLLATRQFLFDLLNPKATPKVPKSIREKAYRLLKHYPSKLDLELAKQDLRWIG